MNVIVEYLGTGILRVINPRERVFVPKRTHLINIFEDYQSSINRGPESAWKDSTGCEYRAWKRQEKHARKNWMRHPCRTENTGGAHLLVDRCIFTL
jgi:hypothetical protein